LLSGLVDLKRIEATEGLTTKTVAQVRSIFFGMDQSLDELRSSNVKGANPFRDIKVREAFNLAIDKDAIQRVVMDGLSFPTGIITPPTKKYAKRQLQCSQKLELK